MNNTPYKTGTVNGNKLAVMPVPLLVLNVSVPLMISMLVQSLYNIVDGIFVSRISEAALAATSFAYPAQMLMLAVAVGTGVGINSLLSRKLGQKDFTAVNLAATNGLFLAVCCSLIFILLGIFCSGFFIQLFTSDSAIIAMGIQYLSICMIGCSGIFLATTGERLLQATGNTFLSMLSQLTGAVANIILDPVLIFGLLGFPAMGIQGAALATIIGQFLAAITALSLNKIKNREIRFVLRGFKPSLSIIKDIYTVGIPTMLMQTMGSFMMMGMNAILTVFSTSAVVLFGIYYKLYTFLYMPVSGLTQGLLPIVGYNYGAKCGSRARQACRITDIATLCIMCIGAGVFICIPGPLLRMYDASPEILKIGLPALRIFAVTFPLAGITISKGFACSALGNGMVSMVSTLLRQLLLLVPLAYIFSSCFGLDTAWYAAWISEAAACTFALFFYNREYKKKIVPIL